MTARLPQRSVGDVAFLNASTGVADGKPELAHLNDAIRRVAHHTFAPVVMRLIASSTVSPAAGIQMPAS
jgi:hypothetical protein